jgi:hypothetical protein
MVNFDDFPGLPRITTDQILMIFKCDYVEIGERLFAVEVVRWMSTVSSKEKFPQWRAFKLSDVAKEVGPVWVKEIYQALNNMVDRGDLIAKVNEQMEVEFTPTIMFARKTLENAQILIAAKPSRVS